MYCWEDEQWKKVHLTANYAANDRASAQPYVIIPARKGHFKVYMECEGFQAVKSIKGKADGSWCGMIAYDTTQSSWMVNEYIGCKITDFRSTTTWVCGHPDVKLNDCQFKPNRGVECDYFCSFDLVCDDDDSKWVIYAPRIQKDSDFNYVVSYANFTDKRMEWGGVSISIDEVNDEEAPKKARLGRREHLLANARPTKVGRHVEGKPLELNPSTEEPVETPSPEKQPEEQIPDPPSVAASGQAKSISELEAQLDKIERVLEWLHPEERFFDPKTQREYADLTSYLTFKYPRQDINFLANAIRQRMIGVQCSVFEAEEYVLRQMAPPEEPETIKVVRFNDDLQPSLHALESSGISYGVERPPPKEKRGMTTDEARRMTMIRQQFGREAAKTFYESLNIQRPDDEDSKSSGSSGSLSKGSLKGGFFSRRR